MQKTWLWIFGAMFVVPEVLFAIIPATLLNYFTGDNFLKLHSVFIDNYFFIDNWYYAFTILIIELVGAFGLMVISIKSKKKTFTVLFGLILLWLIFIIFIGYLFNKISLVI